MTLLSPLQGASEPWRRPRAQRESRCLPGNGSFSFLGLPRSEAGLKREGRVVRFLWKAPFLRLATAHDRNAPLDQILSGPRSPALSQTWPWDPVCLLDGPHLS